MVRERFRAKARTCTELARRLSEQHVLSQRLARRRPDSVVETPDLLKQLSPDEEVGGFPETDRRHDPDRSVEWTDRRQRIRYDHALHEVGRRE